MGWGPKQNTKAKNHLDDGIPSLCFQPYCDSSVQPCPSLNYGWTDTFKIINLNKFILKKNEVEEDAYIWLRELERWRGSWGKHATVGRGKHGRAFVMLG